MKFVAISDLHIKDKSDPAYQKLINFLKSNVCNKTENLFLLGDIFDLMAGYHKEYINEYEDFFKQINVLLKKGIRIEYFEGNHDVQLAKLFKIATERSPLMKIHNKPVLKELSGKKYYFSHGDDLYFEKKSYRRYRNFVSSRPLKFVADYIMPYKVFHYLGTRASKKSRAKHGKEYSDQQLEEIRQKFRIGIEKKWHELKFDVAVIGHSHVVDQEQSPHGYHYFNISSSGTDHRYLDTEFLIKEMP